jgi:predicted DNA-binding transcriptional regulator
MVLTHETELEKLGLEPAEAQVYLAVLRHGPLSVGAVANETGIPRTNIYRLVYSLTQKGLIEGAAGYATKFAAVSPDTALPSLIARDKQAISEREQIAAQLGKILTPLAADTESALDDTVDVVRTPHVIMERWYRFQCETKHSIESLVKAPFLGCGGNPGQKKAQQRKVRYRCVYEQAALEDPNIKPYLAEWIAGGEEARVFKGELPCKVWVADRELVMLTLARRSGQPSAMFIRHAPFARGMGVLFDYFWTQAEPLEIERNKRLNAKKFGALTQANRRKSRNAFNKSRA